MTIPHTWELMLVDSKEHPSPSPCPYLPTNTGEKKKLKRLSTHLPLYLNLPRPDPRPFQLCNQKKKKRKKHKKWWPRAFTCWEHIPRAGIRESKRTSCLLPLDSCFLCKSESKGVGDGKRIEERWPDFPFCINTMKTAGEFSAGE